MLRQKSIKDKTSHINRMLSLKVFTRAAQQNLDRVAGHNQIVVKMFSKSLVLSLNRHDLFDHRFIIRK